MLYETEDDRERQRRVIKRLAERHNDVELWGEMPTTFTADGYLGNGKSVLYWVEVKGRTAARGKWPDERLEVAKWDALSKLEAATGVPVVIAYTYADDEVAAIKLSDLESQQTGLERWGRTDRGEDERDPHIVFPAEALRVIR
jgi:hypothetical protein